jgi:hypothetical protein
VRPEGGAGDLQGFPARGPISDISSYEKMPLSYSTSTSWTFFTGTTRDVAMEAPDEFAVAVRDKMVKPGLSFRLSRRRFNDHPVHRSSQNVGQGPARRLAFRTAGELASSFARARGGVTFAA